MVVVGGGGAASGGASSFGEGGGGGVFSSGSGGSGGGASDVRMGGTRLFDRIVGKAAKDGYKFASGQFIFDSSIFRLSEFSIFRDGLVVNAATTNGSEVFLDDVIKFMREEHSFRDFVTKPRLFFQSQLVVEFDNPPEKLLHSLNQITEIISKPLSEAYDTEINMKFSRLDFERCSTHLSLLS